MKYNITINQKAVIDNRLLGELDIIDLAIFDFVYHFFNSDFEGKVTFTKNGVEYTEIRPALLEREMPLLKIGTKRTFINRMNNLINAGLIERYENNSNENRSGYKKGVNFSIFEFDKPTKKNSQGYENDFTPPMKTDSHNNNNNNITDNNKEERDKSLSKKEKPLWKTNFAEYQKLVEEARAVLKSDNDFRQKMLKFYPNADYDLSIDKSVETFWLTEAGWNNKKKSRGNSIDMVATLKRNFDKNIVYLRYGQKARLDNCNQSAINEDKLVINGVEYE